MMLSILVPPPPVQLRGPNEVCARRFFGADDLATALSGSGARTDIVEGSLSRAPADGFIIIFDSDELSIYPGLGPRTVLLNAERGMVRRDIETYRLAAAVEERDYWHWRWERDEGRETSEGLFAIRSVALGTGAVPVPTFRATEHYGRFSHDAHRNLPEFLVAYLGALEEGGVPHRADERP